MSTWNPAQYLKFKEQRTQPAIDLALRVRNYSPATAVDSGCGPGNSTAVLAEVFPDADILGIDSSPEMIEKAKKSCPALEFRLCDALSLEGTYDLLFSNACLQWIPSHETLIPALMEKLNDGGVLAVQMPMNGTEPLFRVIREVTANPAWDFTGVHFEQNDVLTPMQYHEILAGCTSDFEMWETVYCHRMPDHEALVDWVKGTRLRPYLDALDEENAAALENAVLTRAKEEYPLLSDGKGGAEVVLNFRRFFFLARK